MFSLSLWPHRHRRHRVVFPPCRDSSVSTTGTPSGVTTYNNDVHGTFSNGTSSISAQASSTGGLTVKVTPIARSAHSQPRGNHLRIKPSRLAFSVPPGWAIGPERPDLDR